jgi:hypothetical protein
MCLGQEWEWRAKMWWAGPGVGVEGQDVSGLGLGAVRHDMSGLGQELDWRDKMCLG